MDRLRKGLRRWGNSEGPLLRAKMLSAFYRDRLRVGVGVRIWPGVTVDIDESSLVILCEGVTVLHGAHLVAKNGGTLELGAFSQIGRGCQLVATSSVTIGESTLLAPGVAVYDYDHIRPSDGASIRSTGNASSPVSIGSSCWLGAHVVVLRGTTIEDRVIVAANGVARGRLLAGGTYGGVPARRLHE